VISHSIIYVLKVLHNCMLIAVRKNGLEVSKWFAVNCGCTLYTHRLLNKQQTFRNYHGKLSKMQESSPNSDLHIYVQFKRNYFLPSGDFFIIIFFIFLLNRVNALLLKKLKLCLYLFIPTLLPPLRELWKTTGILLA